jgi:hypothetical protein
MRLGTLVATKTARMSSVSSHRNSIHETMIRRYAASAYLVDFRGGQSFGEPQESDKWVALLISEVFYHPDVSSNGS